MSYIVPVRSLKIGIFRGISMMTRIPVFCANSGLLLVQSCRLNLELSVSRLFSQNAVVADADGELVHVEVFH